jgi:hypothetical protein
MNEQWEYDPLDRASGAPEAIWCAGEVIARVEDRGGPTRQRGRLIAAAPEMLKALRYYAAIKGPVGEPARAAIAACNGDVG